MYFITGYLLMARLIAGAAGGNPFLNPSEVRGTAFIRRPGDPSAAGWFEIDSTEVDRPGRIDAHINPYLTTEEAAASQGESCAKADGAPVPAGPAASAVVAMPVSRKTGALRGVVVTQTRGSSPRRNPN